MRVLVVLYYRITVYFYTSTRRRKLSYNYYITQTNTGRLAFLPIRHSATLWNADNICLLFVVIIN